MSMKTASGSEYYWIEDYDMDSVPAHFTGAYVFPGNNRNFLINRNGYSILLDDELLNEVKSRNVGEELAVTLIQYRFLMLEDEEGENAGYHKQSDDRSGINGKINDIHPVFFMIDLTNRCNMACRYCLREAEDSENRRILSEETAVKICDCILWYCKEADEDKITIQPWGGEPFLELERIFFIQDYLKERGIDPCISVETNGLLLSDEVIDKLYKRDIWTGVSIDGPEAIHDSQRVFRDGRPTHSIVEKNLIKLRDKFQGRVTVITTLTKGSAKYVRKIICYLVKDLELKNVKLNFVHKSSFVDNDTLCMNEDEIAECTREIFETFLELTGEGYDVGDYNIFTKMSNLICNAKEDACISGGCHGGRQMIVFDHNGDIYPCDVTDYPEECLGNIDEGVGLVDIVRRAMRNHTYFAEKKEEKCEDCPWYCYCRGGCTVHVKTEGAEPPVTDRIECAVNRMLYPLMVDKILYEPEQVNLILRDDVM